jgi:excinuclease ABC subunit C
MEMSNIKEKIAQLPPNPGVYTFFDDKKKILYIGKATNLKSRVSSYFALTPSPSPKGRGGIFSRPIEAMIHKVADIKIQETDSVLEALILESNLIKKFQPKYNVERKDDKSFSYVAITKEEFPRVLILRETELYNPSVPSGHLPLIKGGARGGVENFFGPYTSKKQLEIALKIIRKIFPYHSNKQKTEKGCLDFQLGRCSGPYADAISKTDYAQNIHGIKMILEGKKKNLIKSLKREMQDHSKKNEFEKAAELRNKIFALKHIQDVALISEPYPTSILPLKRGGREGRGLRIEAYDISNISGQYAVGSMVVFSDGEPDKSQYRKFKIKTIEGSNDVGMMAEVLFRRFRHSEWPRPDLILLDGGKGQLSMGEHVLKELKLEVPMVAVTKGKDRKIFNFFGYAKSGKARQFSPPAGGFNDFSNEIFKDKNLIQRIMNEAHRFAISYHKKLRKNNFLTN